MSQQKKVSSKEETNLSRRRLFGLKTPKEEVRIIADIDPISCLAYHKTICYSCRDICREYIHFNGLFFPEISQDCIGCEKCLSVCPSNAIFLKEIKC
ncbi:MULTISPECIES: 4Fe-4S binding protein [unclassified Helicobacter]|uniref:4Fe-4S binding protein n=1 Tax=unclassified Helicobacter TaxID=2593540 RepID=UPI000CF0C338|nr:MULTISPECIES: 4Fe-4S binding protein [unclassified Helicobacter]